MSSIVETRWQRVISRYGWHVGYNSFSLFILVVFIEYKKKNVDLTTKQTEKPIEIDPLRKTSLRELFRFIVLDF